VNREAPANGAARYTVVMLMEEISRFRPLTNDESEFLGDAIRRERSSAKRPYKKKRPPRKVWSSLEIATIIERSKSEKPAQIAKDYGVTIDAIYGLIRCWEQII
jgi:hypothetical protein